MFHYVKYTNLKFSSHGIKNLILSSRLKLGMKSPVPGVSDRIPYHCPFKWNFRTKYYDAIRFSLSFKKLAPSLSNQEKPGKRTSIRETVKNKVVRSSYIF